MVHMELEGFQKHFSEFCTLKGGVLFRMNKPHYSLCMFCIHLADQRV